MVIHPHEHVHVYGDTNNDRIYLYKKDILGEFYALVPRSESPGSSDSESDALVSADSEAKQTGVLVCGGVRWCMVECRCGHVWWCAVVWVYDLCKVTTALFSPI